MTPDNIERHRLKLTFFTFKKALPAYVEPFTFVRGEKSWGKIY